MSDNRSFASLTGGLLARKGGARPAMRSPLHLQGNHASRLGSSLSAAAADDLGWNDVEGETVTDHSEPTPVVRPSVADLQQAISARLSRYEEQAPVASEAPSPAVGLAGNPRRSAFAEGRRAAFTLRLDSDRHIKLRLACTLHNRSAQLLITEALDRLFADEPALCALAAQMPSRR